MKRPPPLVHVEIGTPSPVHTTKLPADLPQYRQVVHQRLAGLEELQKSMIAQAKQQLLKKPGDIFLQPLDAVLHQVGELASEIFEARAKVMQVDNFVASFQDVQPCPQRPPVPTMSPSFIDSHPPFKAGPSKRDDTQQSTEGTGSSGSTAQPTIGSTSKA